MSSQITNVYGTTNNAADRTVRIKNAYHHWRYMQTENHVVACIVATSLPDVHKYA
jgi:hypothetical protein